MRRAISLISPSSLALAAGLGCGLGCGLPVESILDVRASADDSRPDAGSDNCVSAGDLVVSDDQVVYVVHALPEQFQSSPGDLEITVATGCDEATYTVTHDQLGIALVPISLPEGADCGVVITTTVANAIDSCVLTGVSEASAGCSFACSSDTGTDTGTASTDTSTDSTG